MNAKIIKAENSELEALTQVIKILITRDSDEISRILKCAAAFFGEDK
jgi:hypothetical protein